MPGASSSSTDGVRRALTQLALVAVSSTSLLKHRINAYLQFLKALIAFRRCLNFALRTTVRRVNPGQSNALQSLSPEDTLTVAVNEPGMFKDVAVPSKTLFYTIP